MYPSMQNSRNHFNQQHLSVMPQHGVSATTAGSTWNGTAWINNSPKVTSLPPPSTELPKIPDHMKASVNINDASASQLVTFYSEVYAFWAGQVTACKTSGDTSSNNYHWAVYYSDLSSRAAHHYNSLVKTPNAIVSNVQTVSPTNQRSSRWGSNTKADNTITDGAKQAAGPPKVFQDYAHRCLSQCVSKTQKDSMKVMIEMTIRKSLQDRTMHSKNWDEEPILPLYQDNKKTNTIAGKSYANAVSNSFSNQNTSSMKKCDGVSTSASPTPSKSKKRKAATTTSFTQDLPEKDSYYGNPSSTKKSKKKESLESKEIPMDSDYISLSSLSSTRYVKKNNGLVKVSPKKTKEGFDATASKLASRANRFSGEGGIDAASSSKLHSVYSVGVDRYMGKTVIGGNSKGKLDEKDYEKMTVKGTCTVLEKEFLRLTAPPRADKVRPQVILEKHLKNIMKLRKHIRSGKIKPVKGKEYNWFCSQLKAIRQDLRVQRIFNAFAVKVYETHARVALEEGDLNEYNQSQTQLKELYEQLSHENGNGTKNQNEFVAYRIIYHVFLTGNKKYEGGSTDLFKIMLNLSETQRKDPYIAHALKVRVAVADNDYHAFFHLQDKCPNLGAHLMDYMVPQMRAIALKSMVKSYRPSLSVDFVLVELGFSFNGKVDRREGTEWLKCCGCKLTEDGSLILTKDCVIDDSVLMGDKKSSLI